MNNLTLTIDLSVWKTNSSDVPRLSIRSVEQKDTEEVGRLYFASYPAGLVGANVDDAIQEIEQTFAGAYGDLWTEASPVAVVRDEVVAALLTVRQAPWDETPEGPFLIELFVHPDFRRRGLARYCLETCLRHICEHGENSASLRVLSENGPALRLYESFGFVEWFPA